MNNSLNKEKQVYAEALAKNEGLAKANISFPVYTLVMNRELTFLA
ncbi:MAG: hypothetical protein WC117_07615 [Sphaerochaetaceae bacterium]